jgi:hypothetical protein
MDDPFADEKRLEDASRELARAIWAVVLLARDEYRARGLIGRAKRKELVEAIVALMKIRHPDA